MPSYLLKEEVSIGKEEIHYCIECGISSKEKSLRVRRGDWYCRKCYSIKRAKENGDACEVCGSYLHSHYRENYDMILCSKHIKHMRRHGKILERTKLDPNEIIVKDTYAEIVLYDKNQKEKGRALIDIEDVEKVSQYKWYLGNNGYVFNDTDKDNRLALHRFVIGYEGDLYLDHINNDRVDCRKENLRVVNPRQNVVNSPSKSNFENEDIGINYNKDKNLWETYIGYKNNRIYLGGFKDKEDAIKTRRQAEIKYFGKYHYNYKELKEKGLIE